MQTLPPLRERVTIALEDARLGELLERGTVRYANARRASIDALPHGEALRDRARTIRLTALANLDRYIEQLAGNVERRGGTVYWASDAAAANRYVVDLARRRQVRSVVKSKSMLSEEIHLNAALAAAGVEAVETDLGEYIVQLAGETPAHIVAPAIHKTKEQVADLFAERLGIPRTDSIPELTAAARRVLRERFLSAGMGVSGVNFAVAETGTIVTVTNEGNGRFCTTTPPIHVALMGIERVVPTMDDLLVLLQVLARSATGQQISVYTNLVTGPARPGEPDGPEELHLVLVDNGRSRVLGSEYAEALACIRCGACLNACPVYRAIGGHAYGGVYSGPIGAVLTPLLQPDLPEASILPELSSLCGACQEACPVRIDLPALLLRLRRDAVAGARPAPHVDAAVPQVPAPQAARRADTRLGKGVEQVALHLWALGMRSPRLYRWGARAARLSGRLLARDGRLTRLPPPLSAWARRRDFPAPAALSFGEQWRRAREEQP